MLVSNSVKSMQHGLFLVFSSYYFVTNGNRRPTTPGIYGAPGLQFTPPEKNCSFFEPSLCAEKFLPADPDHPQKVSLRA